MTAPNLSWGHININVSNLEESIAFYEKLGFTVLIPGVPYLGIERETGRTIPEAQSQALGIPQESNALACIMQLDDGFPKLDLTKFKKDAPQQPGGNDDLGMIRLCLASQDLHADYERLKERGVEFLSEPTKGVGDMADIAICSDPDGALIELIQVHFDKWRS